MCKWVLDIPTTPLTEAKIAGSPLPIASHRIVADNVYEYLEKKRTLSVQYVAKIHIQPHLNLRFDKCECEKRL